MRGQRNAKNDRKEQLKKMPEWFLLAVGAAAAVVVLVVVMTAMNAEPMKKQEGESQSVTDATESAKHRDHNVWSTDIVEVDAETGISYCKFENKCFTSYIAVDDREVVSRELVGRACYSNRGVSDYTGDNKLISASAYSFQVLNLYKKEEGVVSLTYLLENCPGAYIDDVMTNYKDNAIIKSVPYSINVDEQDKMYLLILFVYPNGQDVKEPFNNVLSKARIRVEVLYEDGHTETDYYGLESRYPYNTGTLNIYKLELAEK